MNAIKKYLYLLLLFPLCACFLVIDLGAYKDKLFIDHELVGNWKDVTQNPPKDFRTSSPDKIARFFLKNGKLYTFNNKKGHKPEEVEVKSIKLGKKSFLVQSVETFNILMRYRIEDNHLYIYSLSKKGMKYLMKGLGLEPPKPNSIPMPQIPILDSKTAKFLSEFPVDKKYWLIIDHKKISK